jgi:addiction module HigA family antidote
MIAYPVDLNSDGEHIGLASTEAEAQAIARSQSSGAEWNTEPIGVEMDHREVGRVYRSRKEIEAVYAAEIKAGWASPKQIYYGWTLRAKYWRITASVGAPPHPGDHLRKCLMPAYGLTIAELADHIGVTRVAMSYLVNKRVGLSFKMAQRLGQAFGNGTRFWLTMQMAYDIWVSERCESTIRVSRLTRQRRTAQSH